MSEIPALMGTCVEMSHTDADGVLRVTIEFRDVPSDRAFPVVAGQQALMIGMGPVLRAVER